MTTSQLSATPEGVGAVPLVAERLVPRKPWNRRRWPILLSQIVVVVGFLALWQVAVDRGWLDVSTVSRPTDVAAAFWEYVRSPQMATSTSATGTAVLLAFVIGSVTGTVAGLVMGSSRYLDRVFGPFLVPINSIPRIALAPLFIAWFGLTLTSKVVLAVSIVFFILAENARAAVKSVDPDLVTMARVAGLSRRQMTWKVTLPSAVPTIFSGLRLAITYSVLGVVASEMIAARNGLGQDIVVFSSEYKIDYAFAVLVILAALTTAVSLLFGLLERRLLRWQG